MQSIIVIILLLTFVLGSESLHLPIIGFKSFLKHLPEGLHITMQNPPSYTNFNNPAQNVINVYNPYVDEL